MYFSLSFFGVFSHKCGGIRPDVFFFRFVFAGTLQCTFYFIFFVF